MVRSSKFLALAVASLAGAAALGAPSVMAKDKPTGEEKLQKMLEGRVAGEPVRCIREKANRRMRTINDTAYVYGSGNTIYVQRTQRPESIDDDDILVIRKFGSTQLCRLDQITTVDRFSGFFTGAVFFDDFIPYTREKKPEGADS